MDTRWDEVMVQLYSVGRSDVEVMKELNITRKQFEREYASNPYFREIVEQGRLYAESWWMERVRKGVDSTEQVNPAILKMKLQNTYGWSDKSESNTSTIGVSMTSEEVNNRLAELVSQLPAEKKQKLLASTIQEE